MRIPLTDASDRATAWAAGDYTSGQLVTNDAHVWIAVADTDDEPTAASADWTRLDWADEIDDLTTRVVALETP